MLSFQLSDVPYAWAGAAAALLVLCAAVVYILEIRRSGTSPWSESSTDQVAARREGRRLWRKPRHREAPPSAVEHDARKAA